MVVAGSWQISINQRAGIRLEVLGMFDFIFRSRLMLIPSRPMERKALECVLNRLRHVRSALSNLFYDYAGC